MHLLSNKAFSFKYLSVTLKSVEYGFNDVGFALRHCPSQRRVAQAQRQAIALALMAPIGA
jgi:hypothetical protein